MANCRWQIQNAQSICNLKSAICNRYYPMPSNLRIGTSGWNYPTGRGTWNGVFYPLARTRPKGFDELSFYAEHFDTVEINSTFYGQPKAEVSRKWVERTPRGFEFSVKLYQKFTHPEMFKKALTRGMVDSGWDRAHSAVKPVDPSVDALARPNQADLDQFLAGVALLA